MDDIVARRIDEYYNDRLIYGKANTHQCCKTVMRNEYYDQDEFMRMLSSMRPVNEYRFFDIFEELNGVVDSTPIDQSDSSVRIDIKDYVPERDFLLGVYENGAFEGAIEVGNYVVGSILPRSKYNPKYCMPGVFEYDEESHSLHCEYEDVSDYGAIFGVYKVREDSPLKFRCENDFNRFCSDFLSHLGKRSLGKYTHTREEFRNMLPPLRYVATDEKDGCYHPNYIIRGVYHERFHTEPPRYEAIAKSIESGEINSETLAAVLSEVGISHLLSKEVVNGVCKLWVHGGMKVEICLSEDAFGKDAMVVAYSDIGYNYMKYYLLSTMDGENPW